MIVGVFIRYLKCYGGLTYVPLFKNDHFCGIAGPNGIGKSTILESLDALFNGKPYTISRTSKKKVDKMSPCLVPVFRVPSNAISPENLANAKLLNEFVRRDNLVERNYHQPIRLYQDHISRLNLGPDELLLPIGEDYDRQVDITPFDFRSILDPSDKGEEDVLECFSSILRDIKSYIDFIYIPKEIDLVAFTKLTNDDVHRLMGSNLSSILEKVVDRAAVEEINQNLKKEFDELSNKLENFHYRKSGGFKNTFKTSDVYKVILSAFINQRELHRKRDNLPIDLLSSGERQQAVLEVVEKYVSNFRRDHSNLILALDEPESSLHFSVCLDQFRRLFQLSRHSRQLLFTTHWYGYVPAVERGSLTLITRAGAEHSADVFDVARYREEFRNYERRQGEAKAKKEGVLEKFLPLDVRLKGLSDFVSVLATSVTSGTPAMNWLICEGGSELIYFDYYFANLVANHNLRIIPMAGQANVIKVFNLLSALKDDLAASTQGRILCLIDTDDLSADVNGKDVLGKVLLRRLHKAPANKNIKLLPPESKVSGHLTAIEDALDCGVFHKSLIELAVEADDLGFLSDIPPDFTGGALSGYFNISREQDEKIRTYFSKIGNKIEFSKKYVQNLDNMTLKPLTPGWIAKIESWYLDGAQI